MTQSKGTTGTGAKVNTGRDAALKALKGFYKVELSDLTEDLGETLVRETDRGSVILLSTGVEDMLGRRIRSDMVELNSDEDARLFGPDAPVGTFSAKIKLAYALGMIDRDVARMCDIMREMRNACAHSGRDISFENQELRDVLKVMLRYITDDDTSFLDRVAPWFCKVNLTWITGWLMGVIGGLSKQEASDRVDALIVDLRNDLGSVAPNAGSSTKKRQSRSSPTSPSNRKRTQP